MLCSSSFVTVVEWLACPTVVLEDQGWNLAMDGRVYSTCHCDMQSWAQAMHFYCSAYINSALHPSTVAKSSTSFGWVKAGMSHMPGGR